MFFRNMSIHVKPFDHCEVLDSTTDQVDSKSSNFDNARLVDSSSNGRLGLQSEVSHTPTTCSSAFFGDGQWMCFLSQLVAAILLVSFGSP